MPTIPPAGWRLWLAAVRPRTLTLAVAPVVAGTALALAEGHDLRPLPLALALAGAVLIQVGTNLYNDVADTLRGGDRPGRVGPPRVTAQGWASPLQVRRAAAVSFALAAAVGSALVWLGGWPIAVLGALSLAAGWSYSCGPVPISYTPFGEVMVVLFFGLGAVGGTAWLQAGRLPAAVLPLGLALGLPAAAVLMANNYRDAAADRLAGRRTLAIVLGPAASRALYAALMLLPFALSAALPRGAWAGLLALPAAVACILDVRSRPAGAEFNRILAATARVQLLFAVATGMGMIALR